MTRRWRGSAACPGNCGIWSGAAPLAATPPRYSLRAQLDGLGYAPKDDAPGFSGLQGELSATETGGRLAMTGQPFELQAARVFAQPLRFDRLDGALDWTRDAQGWQVSMPAFGWALEGTQGEGDLQLTLPTEGRSEERRVGKEC